MKQFYVIISFLISVCTYSQCFDCAKNYGGWTNDNTRDIDIDNNGNIYLTYSSGIIKHNSNCEIIWTKLFNNILFMNVSSMTTDSNGNVYLLLDYRLSLNALNGGPFSTNGITYHRGLNLIKFDALGNFLWNRLIGERISYNIQKIYNIGNDIYITGAFYDNININGQISFNTTYSDHAKAFVVKYDLNGNLINANYFGDGIDDYINSEIDTSGNIYLTKFNANYGTNYARSAIEKISPDLQNIWTKEISNNNNNNSLYRPTNLYYNSTNNKLYLWGAFNQTVNVLGNYFTINDNNGVFQSLLSEFDTDDGHLVRISRYNNSSEGNLPGVIGSLTGNTGYISHKDNNLYILTSYKKTMNFSNQTITSASFVSGGTTYYTEDLVLFKVDLNNFSSEFIFKSINQTPYLNVFSKDYAGPILFNNNDLIITSTFTSKPIEINGTIINNNSGNQDSDVLFYKFNINDSNSGEIIVNNTCFNDVTHFELSGNFNSIEWNFGDISSPNNIITGINNPSHEFSNPGSYHITATVDCGGAIQTIEKDIIISNVPTLNNVTPLIECETIQGSGISSTFNTANLNIQLIGNQQNVTLEYRNSNGIQLANPLPNPYTNTNIGGDILTAKVYNSNNPDCYLETEIVFTVKSKPVIADVLQTQQFCIQDNATIAAIPITGQNITWYDAASNGTVLPASTVLQDGVTYYASQTINGCESETIPVTVTIQNTVAPTGNNNQSFCSTANATLNEIVVTGTAITWYDSLHGNVILSNNTPLADGTTYYATQTVNGCESTSRLAVTVSLINTLNATNYSESLCDAQNDGHEVLNLANYTTYLISSAGNTFRYYTSENAAENEINQEEIINFSNYTLPIGSQIIYVRIDSPNTCHQIVELELTLYSNPILNITDIMPICEGSSITIAAGNGYDSYLWSTNETTPSIVVSQPGSYAVTVTQNHGTLVCTTTKDFTVVQSNIGSISEIISSDWTDTENTITVLLSGSSSGDYEYSLDGIHYQESNIFNGLQSGLYTVYINDRNGCGEVKETVFLLMYPKFFTPNGDGYNDFWKIQFSENEPHLRVQIFDRYGKFIKELGSNTQGWDGTYLGKMLPSNDYWFTVTRENGKVYKGHFSLKR